MANVRAGKLRHVIRVERRIASSDEYGATIYNWTLVATRRASVEPLSGDERVEASQLVGELLTLFRIRWLDGLLTTMRIVWGGRAYDIISVSEDGIKHVTEIRAKRNEVPLSDQSGNERIGAATTSFTVDAEAV